MPLLARREADAARIRREAMLETDIKLLGQEAVAAREVVGAAPEGQMINLVGFFEQWMKGARGNTPAVRGLPPQAPGSSLGQ